LRCNGNNVGGWVRSEAQPWEEEEKVYRGNGKDDRVFYTKGKRDPTNCQPYSRASTAPKMLGEASPSDPLHSLCFQSPSNGNKNKKNNRLLMPFKGWLYFSKKKKKKINLI
jgi:hypothetical protein